MKTLDGEKPSEVKYEGFLFKEGNNLVKDWRKRWVELENTKLSYYKTKVCCFFYNKKQFFLIFYCFFLVFFCFRMVIF